MFLCTGFIHKPNTLYATCGHPFGSLKPLNLMGLRRLSTKKGALKLYKLYKKAFYIPSFYFYFRQQAVRYKPRYHM
jgi:hypothetical protein